MTAFNVVRFRVKPGQERHFVEAHRKMKPAFTGFLGGHLIQTGERTFCLVGEWRSLKNLVAARPAMIALLDGVRDQLEDLGGGLGVTDPVSGEVVAKLASKKPAPKRAATERPKAKAKHTPIKRKR